MGKMEDIPGRGHSVGTGTLARKHVNAASVPQGQNMVSRFVLGKVESLCRPRSFRVLDALML